MWWNLTMKVISHCRRSDFEYPFNDKMLKFLPDDGNDVLLWRTFIFWLRYILVYLIKQPDVIRLYLTISHVPAPCSMVYDTLHFRLAIYGQFLWNYHLSLQIFGILLDISGCDVVLLHTPRHYKSCRQNRTKHIALWW